MRNEKWYRLTNRVFFNGKATKSCNAAVLFLGIGKVWPL